MELWRKLFLIGFLQLIPHRLLLLRLVLALMLSIGHHALLLMVAPHRQASTAFLAASSSLTLVFTLLAALLVKFYDELPGYLVVGFFGFENPMPLIMTVIVFNFSVVIVAAALIVVTFRAASERWLRYETSHDVVQIERLAVDEYHIFLSHAWISGQDQVHALISTTCGPPCSSAVGDMSFNRRAHRCEL